MDTYKKLSQLMTDNFSLGNLKGISPEDFKEKLDRLMNVTNAGMEGYANSGAQRDLSIRFHWGHNHDFGSFQLEGKMGYRHIAIPAKFIDELAVPLLDLKGKRILDIGVWTGGTSLLFSALGAEVVAIEEVKKYCLAVEFLQQAFDLKMLSVHNLSLYDLDSKEFSEAFDYVFFSGVIYHVTDPVIALRIVFNALKDGGKALIETYADRSADPIFRYEGPTVFGSGTSEDLSRSGWNWFVPSRPALIQMMTDVGFESVEAGPIEGDRVLSVGTRNEYKDILRSGLSVKDIR